MEDRAVNPPALCYAVDRGEAGAYVRIVSGERETEHRVSVPQMLSMIAVFVGALESQWARAARDGAKEAVS